MPKLKTYPKYLPANNPLRIERDISIIADAKINGLTYKRLNAKYNLTDQTIATILRDEDYKDILDGIQKREIIGATRASERIDELIESKTETIALNASTKRLQNIGIGSAHTQTNISIGKFYQQNNALSLTPDVLRLLSSNGIDATIDIPGYGDDEA